jgi:hypothetical protein
MGGFSPFFIFSLFFYFFLFWASGLASYNGAADETW